MPGSASERPSRQGLAALRRASGRPVAPDFDRGGLERLSAMAVPLLAWTLLIAMQAMHAMQVMQGATAAPLEDPTRPPAAPAPRVAEERSGSAPGFRVSLLKLSGSLRLAVVNGRSVREGDEVDGARVLAIGREGVTLDYRGERVLAAMPGAGGEAGEGFKTRLD